jgi:multicomponent Na+:H+ antiporter subunit E
MKLPFHPAAHLFVLVFGLYLVSSGHWHDPLLVGLGVVSAAGVVLLCLRMGIVDRDALPLDLFFGWLGYIPWLFREVVVSNLGVIRRVLDPRMPISPRVIHLRASQESDVGRVTYANSITLTPGTLTLDLDQDQLTVHAIAVETAEDLQGGEMDRRARRMEEHGR